MDRVTGIFVSQLKAKSKFFKFSNHEISPRFGDFDPKILWSRRSGQNDANQGQKIAAGKRPKLR